MNGSPLFVIGIGHDGARELSEDARAQIESAGILAGGRRNLDFFPHWQGEKIVLGSDVTGFVETLKRKYQRQKTVVLASGDPLFYGIGRALLEAIPRDDLVFLPQLSSVQLAFARIKETWHDAQVVSVHGRPLEALAPHVQARQTKIAVLTDARNHPAAIGDLLRRLDAAAEYELWVCENLGGSDERLSRYAAAELRDETFSPLNVVILLLQKEKAKRMNEISPLGGLPLLGIPETALLHQDGPRGMITRREIRLLALCYLELRPGNALWDVGAGSGSVSLEAGRLSERLQIFAVERDAIAFDRLQTNVARFGQGLVHAVHGAAPGKLLELPDPDAIFVGGSGGQLAEILEVAANRLKPGGRIVLNCITLENFSRGWDKLQSLGLEPEATSVQLAHSRPLGSLHSFEPENPIFILRGRKK